MQKIRVSGQIFGAVQGVFYRRFLWEKARELGVVGWVRNISDGSVYFTAEGEREVLGVFFQQLQKGPLSATVENIDAHWSEATNEFFDFTILPSI